MPARGKTTVRLPSGVLDMLGEAKGNAVPVQQAWGQLGYADTGRGVALSQLLEVLRTCASRLGSANYLLRRRSGAQHRTRSRPRK